MLRPIKPRSGHPSDEHVGGQIRLRRKILGIGQDQLAAAVGLTFQQIQKYEYGRNRVSASKLYDIARALDVPVETFFLGLPDLEGAKDNHRLVQAAYVGAAFLELPEGRELARYFLRIPQNEIRRQIIALVRAAVDEQD